MEKIKINGAVLNANNFYTYDFNQIFINNWSSDGEICGIFVSDLGDGLKCYDIDNNGNITPTDYTFQFNQDNSGITKDLIINIQVGNVGNITFTPYTSDIQNIIRDFKTMLDNMANGICLLYTSPSPRDS